MNEIQVMVCGGVGFLISWLLIPFILRHSVQRRAESASFHHTHKTPTSRLGGLALAASFAAVSGLVLLVIELPPERKEAVHVIVFATLAMCLLGVLDDIRPLGAKRKLLGQFAVALAAYAGGIQIEQFRLPGIATSVEFGMASPLITVFWIVALTNLINLIDGVDGLAGGIALMLMALLVYSGFGGGLSFQVLVAAGMAGALLGFLRYNFPPARIYMGDGGAYLLGCLIALLTIVNSQKGTVVAALIAPLFALALPILDVTLAILRRGLKGLPIFRPDRSHIHHRLLQSGYSRKKTVLMLHALSLAFLVLALAVFWSDGRWAPTLFGFLCLILLFAARTVSFSRDWFAVGRVVVNSIELRKETRYALILSQWLELESERCDSIDDLWEGFGFMARKLGFDRAMLVATDNSSRSWQRTQSTEQTGSDRGIQKARIDLNMKHFTAMEFAADRAAMDERHFDLLTELAAEAWSKAANRWQKLDEPIFPGTPLPATNSPAPAMVRGKTFATT